MIVDAETVKEVDGRILGKLINKRAEDTARLIKLKDYYLGKHDVLYRRPKGKGLPNNKTVCNHAKYIVDMTQGYLLGAPIAYSAADGIDIEPLKNAYFESEIQTAGLYGICLFTDIHMSWFMRTKIPNRSLLCLNRGRRLLFMMIL